MAQIFHFSFVALWKADKTSKTRQRHQMHKHNIKIKKNPEVLQAKLEVIIVLVSKAFREHSATSYIKYALKLFIICYNSCCRFGSLSRVVFIHRQ